MISLDEASGFCDRSSQKQNAVLYISKPKVHTKETNRIHFQSGIPQNGSSNVYEEIGCQYNCTQVMFHPLIISPVRSQSIPNPEQENK